MVLGVPLGLLMGLQPRAAAALGDIMQFLRPLPPLSYMILLILWFGTGDGSKVALLFLTALPIIASAAMAGVRLVPRPRILAARSLGRRVLAGGLACRAAVRPCRRSSPACALRSPPPSRPWSPPNCWRPPTGSGWMVLSASRFLRSDVILLGIIILGLSGMALSRVLVLVERRLVHWHGRA